MHRHGWTAVFLVVLATTPALAADERDVPKLLKQLKDKKDEKRIEASFRLVEMKAESAVPAFIEALNDPNGTVRYNAAGALWNLREAARPAVAALRDALRNDADMRVRLQAAGALRGLDEAAAEWLPAVRRGLDDQSPEVRQLAKKLMKLIEEGHDLHVAASQGQTELVAGLLDGGLATATP